MPDYTERNLTSSDYGPVDITWNQHGVPEVSSPSDLGAFYGWGYAMCVDRFFQMEVARRVMRGTQAELLGNAPIGTKNVNPLNEDKVARRFRYEFFAQKALDSILLDHSMQHGKLVAFSAGINAYLEEFLGQEPTWDTDIPAFQAGLAQIDDLFAANPLIPQHFSPWTPLDTILVGWRLQELPDVSLSTPLLRQKLYNEALGNPPPEGPIYAALGSTVIDSEAVTVRELDVTRNIGHYADLMQYAGDHGWTTAGAQAPPLNVDPSVPLPKFSHGFAVGGPRTTTGRSVLLGMPQLRADKKLIEMSVKGATFTSRGVCFPGIPGYMVGYTDHVAWTATGAGPSIKAAIALTSPAPDQYTFGGVTSSVDESQVERVYYREDGPSGPTWPFQEVTVRWANDVHHTDLSDPAHEQGTREGIPILTDQQDAFEEAGYEYGLLEHRFFDNTRDTVIAYIDMLEATTVSEFQDAMDEYTTPSINCIASDKDGNVGYFYAKPILLHSPLTSVAALGALGVQYCTGPEDLPTDVIPMRFLPWVMNPGNQLVAGVRSELEYIVMNGNNGAVGSWYPLPTYSGTGDSLRSARWREMFKDKGPDDDWSPEDLLGFHYDDVHETNRSIVRAGLQMRGDPDKGDIPHQDLGTYALDFLERLVDSDFYLGGQNWADAGGHMHSRHPLINIITYVGTTFRTFDFVGGTNQPSPYKALTDRFGQTETGRTRLDRHLREKLDAGLSIFDGLSSAEADELANFIDDSLGNAEVRATLGYPNQHFTANTPKEYEIYLPPATDWGRQFITRTFSNEKPNKTSGALYNAEFHNDFATYGSLDTTNDIESFILHNPNSGISNQADNFYAQWVHFRWHDWLPTPGVLQPTWVHAHTVFNPGNSLHPSSPFFDNNKALWARGGLSFVLSDALATPTQHFRVAPLQ